MYSNQYSNLRLSLGRTRWGVPAWAWLLFAAGALFGVIGLVDHGPTGGSSSSRYSMLIIESPDGKLSADHPLARDWQSAKAIFRVDCILQHSIGGSHPTFGRYFVDPRETIALQIDAQETDVGTVAKLGPVSADRFATLIQQKLSSPPIALLNGMTLRSGMNTATAVWPPGAEYNKRAVLRYALIAATAVLWFVGMYTWCVPHKRELRSERLRASLCPKCEYSIAGIERTKCPECGESLGISGSCLGVSREPALGVCRNVAE